jgi:hypothetical protein
MPADAVSQGESPDEPRHTIYLSKHPRYELTVIAPQGSPTRLNREQAVVHTRLTTTGQVHDLKVVYEDLSQLREYLRSRPAFVPHRDST